MIFHGRAHAIVLIASFLLVVHVQFNVSAASWKSGQHRRGESVPFPPPPPGKGKESLSGQGGQEGGFMEFEDSSLDGQTTGPVALSAPINPSPSFQPSLSPSKASPFTKTAPTPTADIKDVTLKMTVAPTAPPITVDFDGLSSSPSNHPNFALRLTASPSTQSPVSVPTHEPKLTLPEAKSTDAPVGLPASEGGPTTTAPSGVDLSDAIPNSTPSLSPSAPFSSPISSGSLTNASEPFELSDSVVVCPGNTSLRQEVVSWSYSVTLKRHNFTAEVADGAVEKLEPALQLDLLDMLKCHKVTDLGILGIDYLPDDLREKECQTNTSLPCFVYIGSMFIYLGPNADPDLAVLAMRKEIRAIMKNYTDGSIAKVKSLKYLGPALPSVSGAETSETNKIDSNQVSSPTAVPVLSAVGAVFFMLTLAAAYRFRRDRTRAIDPSTIGPSTFAPSTPSGGSSIMKDPDGASSKASPDVSHRLPDAYRQSYTMGAILEHDNSDSASCSRNSDIIVSECGYTDDDSSRDQESFMCSSTLQDESILGAREIDDGSILEAREIDDGLEEQGDAFHPRYDTSEPPPSLTSDSNKEVRFQLRA